MCVFVCLWGGRTAPYVEFTKPLQDVEVREREAAKFECEVSRESAKVRPPAASSERSDAAHQRKHNF